MAKETFRVGELAKILGLSPQTLRRWDEEGKLEAERTSDDDGHRIYGLAFLESKVEDGSLSCLDMAEAWATGDGTWEPLGFLHASTSPIFAHRLHKLEQRLSSDKRLGAKFSLVTSAVGEIGNNSYDHNLGSWPDIQGIFFGYNLQERYVVLADRGQGILTTLRRVRPDLSTHKEALEVAFTEILSGRSPENRGNGLKYVRKIVTENNLGLTYQTGDAMLKLKNGDTALEVTETKTFIQGCMATITF